MLALEQQAHELAGQPFNLDSPKQLGEILFERAEAAGLAKTPTGQPSTDEDVLERLAARLRAAASCILEYRAWRSCKSTYTDKLPQMVNRDTGRVHTTLQPGGRGDRAAVVDRSEPAEHPDPHRARAAASARRSSRRRAA